MHVKLSRLNYNIKEAETLQKFEPVVEHPKYKDLEIRWLFKVIEN